MKIGSGLSFSVKMMAGARKRSSRTLAIFLLLLPDFKHSFVDFRTVDKRAIEQVSGHPIWVMALFPARLKDMLS
jgi:hypothetical protein